MPVPPLVLSVDDYEDDLLLVSLVVKDLGCASLSASDGQTALVLAQRHRPDLILLDIRLPEIDGLEVMRRLKRNRRTCNIPVIAVTAAASDDDRSRILAGGCVGYVVKPYPLEELESLILLHTSYQPHLAIG
ncbi:MAG TPA: response regulator [Trichocoleus sp.]